MMRKTSRTGSFFLVFLFNLFLNFHLTVPGWILLALHFIIPAYIKWWFCLVWFGAILLYLFIWMAILGFASKCANTAEPAPPKKNLNPYSSQGYKPIDKQ